jgi:hypothetical protein
MEALERVPDKNEIAVRNRKILLEHIAGRNLDDIGLRYAIPVEEVRSCVSAAFDDIKAASFHKDVRSVLVGKIVENIQKIEDWMQQLSPKYKRYHQQLTMDGDKEDLWEDADDHLVFVKFQTELRGQYALLKTVLGAEIPNEVDDAKDHIQKKMMDALSMALSVAKGAQDKMPVQRSIIDVNKEDIIEGEVVERKENDT